MKDYLLFIDTEASGLPKKWTEPYSKKDNWPYAVQISWLVYKKNGEEVKREDHYIRNNDFSISKDSIKIHGITREFLDENGEDRAEVLQRLYSDLITYNPLVVGHFMELDYHVMAADFYREGIQNPVETLSLPAFCTMLTTTRYVKNPARKFMRLGELYSVLFKKELEKPHNAIYDAKATADCFFELFNRGELDEEKVDNQKLDLRLKTEAKKPIWLLFAATFLLILFIVFIYE